MVGRKRLIIFLILAVIMLQLFANPPPAEGFDGQNNDRHGTALFPDSLTVIEDEAFEGTAFRTLVFKAGFLRIQDRVFSSMQSLRKAYFPSSVEYIADSAFSGSGLLSIGGYADTYVQQWAEQHDMQFNISDYWYTAPNKVQRLMEKLLSLFFILCLPVTEDARRIKRYIKKRVISMRPQDRVELNPIDYRFP